ncbi:DedA family protein [Bacillus haikouensis]|jgi:membrane protein YqaA with SNARE-associated domain|uniref:YqaA family protein n=1 Tax=Bacillus haikouensis TaxID=1510468 RepID=UPI001553742C|nr:YqaA family protein [Bacillus haikouensis]NQD67173.1 DedA family protein [Bacillus haikouensis]
MSELLHSFEAWLLDYGVWGLILVSFADSSFFPIPPDVLLIPLAIANPENALLYALYTTVASVIGALFGWWIGKKLGRPILVYLFSEERIQKVEEYFMKYGPMALLIAGLTPVPYKIFTIFAGVSGVKIRVLVIWSIIGRGIRFFLEGAIILALGAKAKPFIEENFTMLTLTAGGILLLAYIIYLVIRKKKHTV